MPRLLRIATFLLLAFLALFYLQFGLQALTQAWIQGVLTMVGAIALGWAAILIIRRRQASAVVFLGTVPVLVLHGAMTLVEPGELPFLIASIPIPLVAGAVWLIGRRSRSEARSA